MADVMPAAHGELAVTRLELGGVEPYAFMNLDVPPHGILKGLEWWCV